VRRAHRNPGHPGTGSQRTERHFGTGGQGTERHFRAGSQRAERHFGAGSQRFRSGWTRHTVPPKQVTGCTVANSYILYMCLGSCQPGGQALMMTCFRKRRPGRLLQGAVLLPLAHPPARCGRSATVQVPAKIWKSSFPLVHHGHLGLWTAH
jgi:hypothetical protein